MRGFLFTIFAMHHLYIIYSKKLDRYYVGETPEIGPRLAQHNAHHFKRSFTKGAEDWQLVFSKECKDRGDACYLERFIKRMKSRKFVKKVLERPCILDDILAKR
ncbi:Hypothetical protein I595_1116 [Croceitalea dokdonensis DOKDO 023]|uniref:GIY-YIG domain-containing protein n=2 Tax=Croceitalea TaxID=574891 RepID=A0A0P7AGU7_9FLAO|nr:Hypothetical protein I595_1116 [Croceitalea dokdonensis DOKDO 023]